MKARSVVFATRTFAPVALAAFALACFDYQAVDDGTGQTSDETMGNGPTGNGPMGSAGNSPVTPSTSDVNDGLPPNTATLPCDILGDAGLPCQSAHSTVRVVVGDYSGPLYQLKRPDGGTQDIFTVNGYADVAAHDEFCTGGGCVFEILYDQTGRGLHLTIAPPGSAKPTPGNPVNASDLPIKINGRSAYGMLFRPGMGYRSACNECPYPPDTTTGLAVGDDPQTMYMVSSQHDLINGCCFDYGNAERTANNDGNGTMEAVYLGMGVIWGTGSGEGPWVMADLENGLYPGWENGQDRNISTNTSVQFDFVSAVVVGDTADKNSGKGRFAIYGGDATAGELTEMYDGIRPEKPGYVPMQKQGSLILGIGGDNSDGDGGRFYEGVVANGAASRETVDALQAALVAAGYDR